MRNVIDQTSWSTHVYASYWWVDTYWGYAEAVGMKAATPDSEGRK